MVESEAVEERLEAELAAADAEILGRDEALAVVLEALVEAAGRTVCVVGVKTAVTFSFVARVEETSCRSDRKAN